MEILGYTVPLFFVGVFGSLVVEAASIVKCYHREQPFPRRFAKPGFYFWQFVISLGSGFLVVAYDISKPIVALQIGASAPTIFLAMARTETGDRDTSS